MRDIPVLSLRDVNLSFGSKTLFDNLTIDIGRFDKITLVGHNGCGKSTLLKVLDGHLPQDTGERYEEPGINIVYMEQDPVFENEEISTEKFLRQQLKDPSLFYKAEEYTQSLEVNLKNPISILSGGERRRLALVSTFMQEPDVILMDEPTNHLDLSTIQWLERKLISFRGAFVVISHDRTFLSNITTAILWIERGHIHRLDKGFEYFYDWQSSLLDQEAQQMQRLGSLLKKEQRWLHRGVTARRKRNQGRIQKLHELREQRATLLQQPRTGNWNPPKEISASKVIIEAFNISKSFGDRVLVNDFSTRILKGDRIGIIGPNGAGKTTLLKLLTGAINPDVGLTKIGKKIDIVYLDQHRSELNPKKSIKEILCPSGGDHVGIGEEHRHVISYLKDFLFSPEQVDSKISTLSGGERNRLLLAKSLSLPSSILILDEPTNDLDMDTLDILQDMLDSYAGTILMVSHDRDFLDKTVTSIISFEENGKLIEYAGSYSDFLSAQKRKEKNVELKSQKPKITPFYKKKPAIEYKNRLTYKHTYRLKKIPTEMQELEKTILCCEEQLHDTTFYERDPKAFNKLSFDLESYEEKKMLLEEEWLKLELIQEELKIKKDEKEKK